MKLTSTKVNACFFIGRNGQLGGADASDNEMRMVVGISQVLYFSCRNPGPKGSFALGVAWLNECPARQLELIVGVEDVGCVRGHASAVQGPRR